IQTIIHTHHNTHQTALITTRLSSELTNSIVTQKNSTLKEIMFAPKPMVWVKAHGELSRMISFTCQNSRTDERIYPISPIIHVKDVASMMSAYCERTEI